MDDDDYEKYVDSVKERFAEVRESVLSACVGNDAASIRAAAEDMMHLCASEEFFIVGNFDDERKSMEATMPEIESSLRRCGWSAADMIVWVYWLSRPSNWFYVGSALGDIVDAPCGEYARPEVWREVAERLQQEMDEFSGEQLDGSPSDGSRQLFCIRDSWNRAGSEENALECWLKYVGDVHMWMETVEFLNEFGRYDEAIEISRRGIRASKFGECYSNDYAGLMMEPLADAFSGKGDHLKAAAILAEQFLHWIGAYEHHRSVKSFNKVLEEADKAGVREETRRAILHALKTGVNPAPLCDAKVTAPVREFFWKPVPKLVAFRAYDAQREAPVWPLPRSNEGPGFSDLRWNTMKMWCQDDQEFLLKLAIADGDKHEIARRFDDLPEFPNDKGFALSDEKLAMLDAVAVAVADIRPDIAEKIRVWPNRGRGATPSRPEREVARLSRPEKQE